MSDIKNFLSKKAEQSHCNLFVVHNLCAQDLISHLSEYDGLLAPSLAIINGDHEYSSFGDISIVFKPETIFNGKQSVPRSDRTSYVYDADSYSVRFPEIQYDFQKKESNILYNELEKFEDITMTSLAGWYYGTKKGLDNSERFLLNQDTMKLKFITEHHDKDFCYKLERKKTKPKALFSDTKVMSQYLKNNKILLTKSSFDIEKMHSVLLQAKKEKIDAITNRHKNSTTEIFRKRMETKLNEIEEAYKSIITTENPLGITNMYQKILLKDQDDIITKSNFVYDGKKNTAKLDKYLKKHNLLEKYEKFCSKTTMRMYNNPHIEIGTQKKEVNEENILKYMRKEGSQSSEKTFTHSLGKSRSQTARRIIDMIDLFDKRNELISKKDTDELRDSRSKEFMALSDDLYEYRPDDLDSFDFMDTLSEIIGSHYSTDTDRLPKTFNRLNFKEIPQELLKKIREFSSNFASDKVHYFEAKPLRKIEYTEIAGVVLPRNTSSEIKDLLKFHGITNLKYYSESDPKSRKLTINKLSDFAINEAHFQALKNEKIRQKKLKNRP